MMMMIIHSHFIIMGDSMSQFRVELCILPIFICTKPILFPVCIYCTWGVKFILLLLFTLTCKFSLVVIKK